MEVNFFGISKKISLKSRDATTCLMLPRLSPSARNTITPCTLYMVYVLCGLRGRCATCNSSGDRSYVNA